MGVSTDAILFFGYCWDEECEPFTEVENFEDPDFDVDDFILQKYGFRPEPEEVYGTDPSKADEWSTYWKEKHVFLDSLPEIIRHCHYDHVMYGIAMRGTKIEAVRGCPKEAVFTHSADMESSLKEFCEKLGIKPQDQPKWWLVSYADF